MLRWPDSSATRQWNGDRRACLSREGRGGVSRGLPRPGHRLGRALGVRVQVRGAVLGVYAPSPLDVLAFVALPLVAAADESIDRTVSAGRLRDILGDVSRLGPSTQLILPDEITGSPHPGRAAADLAVVAGGARAWPATSRRGSTPLWPSSARPSRAAAPCTPSCSPRRRGTGRDGAASRCERCTRHGCSGSSRTRARGSRRPRSPAGSGWSRRPARSSCATRPARCGWPGAAGALTAQPGSVVRNTLVT